MVTFGVRARAACCAAVLGAFLFASGPAWAEVNCAQSPGACCCSQHVGNVDCSYDNSVDIADLSLLIDYLFISFLPLPAKEQANMEPDPAGAIDIGDLTALIDHLFLSFRSLPACPGPVNHPPETYLVGWISGRNLPYINTANPTGNPRLRVPVRWRGDDKLDNPVYPKPLTYEWRVYGPYDSATSQTIRNNFIKTVFVTWDGTVYLRGLGTKIPVCDTIPFPGGTQILCDTVAVDAVDAIVTSGQLGYLDTILTVDDPSFSSNPALNRIVQSSGTPGHPFVADTLDTLYDLFAQETHSQTITRDFFLWVRSRDADDSNVVDVTPSIVGFSVIDPKHENDVLVVYGNAPFTLQSVKQASAQSYWQQAINAWSPGASYQYLWPYSPTGVTLQLALLLEHKIVVIYLDDVISGILQAGAMVQTVMAAQEAGVGVWICGRSFGGGDEDGLPATFNYASTDWSYYFGLNQYFFSGWNYFANGMHYDPALRIEDFTGAKAILTEGWPDLVVDSQSLHSRYNWNFEWDPSIGCAPEINVCTPSPGTEPLYSYQSKYGNDYPFDSVTYAYQGGTVAYRLDRGFFRVVVTNFSPVFMGDSIGEMQIVVDSIMNWLYDPSPGQRVTLKSSPPHTSNSSSQDAEPAIVERRAQ